MNLLRLVWPNIWSTMESIPCALEKNVYSVSFGWKVLYISVKYSWSKVSFNANIFMLILCGWSIYWYTWVSVFIIFIHFWKVTFTVVTKYWLYSSCYTIYSWAHLTPNSFYLPLPHFYIVPPPPLIPTSLFSASVNLLIFCLLICCIF